MSNISEKEYLEIIQRLVEPSDQILHGIGDDAAVVLPPAGKMVIAHDLFIEDIHFRRNWCRPDQAAFKAIAVNLSDLAAMSAKPLYATIGLALPAHEREWIEAFYTEAVHTCRNFDIAITGGDISTSETVVIDICLIGSCKNPTLLSTARPGDSIGVTGTLGAAAMGLLLAESGEIEHPLVAEFLQPPIRLNALNEYRVSAVTDISDGLQNEIETMQSGSGHIFQIDNSQLPLHPLALETAHQKGIDLAQRVMEHGEDYELLFTYDGPTPEGCTRIGEVVKSN